MKAVKNTETVFDTITRFWDAMSVAYSWMNDLSDTSYKSEAEYGTEGKRFISVAVANISWLPSRHFSYAGAILTLHPYGVELSYDTRTRTLSGRCMGDIEAAQITPEAADAITYLLEEVYTDQNETETAEEESVLVFA